MPLNSWGREGLLGRGRGSPWKAACKGCTVPEWAEWCVNKETELSFRQYIADKTGTVTESPDSHSDCPGATPGKGKPPGVWLVTPGEALELASRGGGHRRSCNTQDRPRQQGHFQSRTGHELRLREPFSPRLKPSQAGSAGAGIRGR